MVLFISIPQYVREHLMVFIVLTVKRGILDSNGQQVLDVFIEEVSHILIDQSHKEVSTISTCIISMFCPHWSGITTTQMS